MSENDDHLVDHLCFFYRVRLLNVFFNCESREVFVKLIDLSATSMYAWIHDDIYSTIR